ncbi:MAG TPA: hypothetical protein VFD92_14380 [Candidatus Binatia bacterium]|nr:hypothetical protein [Candidatus Binatia bacterium]
MRAPGRPRWVGSAAFVASTLLVASAAIWNGYPLVSSDTGAYVASSFALRAPIDRPVFYGLFLRAAHVGLSLWPVAIIQSALVVAAVLRVMDVYAPVAGRAVPVVAVAALVATTPLAWVAGQVAPDAWTGVLVLTLFVLLHDPRARGWRSVWVGLAFFWSVVVDASHLPLAAGLVAVDAIRARGRGAGWLPAGALRRAALVLLASVVFALGASTALAGRPFLAKTSWTFVLSRLVEDGIVQQLLADVCDRAPPPYRLCAHRRDIRPSALHFIWDPESPVHKLGGLQAVEGEARAIVLDSLRRHPWMHAQAAVRSWLDQLMSFETGDGLQPYGRGA